MIQFGEYYIDVMQDVMRPTGPVVWCNVVLSRQEQK